MHLRGKWSSINLTQLDRFLVDMSSTYLFDDTELAVTNEHSALKHQMIDQQVLFAGKKPNTK